MATSQKIVRIVDGRPQFLAVPLPVMDCLRNQPMHEVSYADFQVSTDPRTRNQVGVLASFSGEDRRILQGAVLGKSPKQIFEMEDEEYEALETARARQLKFYFLTVGSWTAACIVDGDTIVYRVSNMHAVMAEVAELVRRVNDIRDDVIDNAMAGEVDPAVTQRDERLAEQERKKKAQKEANRPKPAHA